MTGKTVGKQKGLEMYQPANLHKTEKDAKGRINNTIILLQAREENKRRN